MTEILTESFCERCGTRYTFESTAPRQNRMGGIRVLGRGLKNFVLSDDSSLDEAMAAARSDVEREATAQQLDAFHRTFNFCMSCRQYTCGNCWNDVEARCLSCAPLPEAEIVAAELAAPPAGVDLERLFRLTAPASEAAWPSEATPARDVAPELVGEAEVAAERGGEAEPELLGEAEVAGEPELFGMAEVVAHADVEPVAPEPVEAADREVAEGPAVAGTDGAAPGALPDWAVARRPAEASVEELPPAALASDPAQTTATEAPAAADLAAYEAEMEAPAPAEAALRGLEPGESLDDAIAAYEASQAAVVQAEAVAAEGVAGGGPGVDVVEQPTWPYAPAAAEPKPEPVAAEPEPEPVAAEPEAEPIAAAPAPEIEPELVAAAPEPIAEPEPEPVAAAPQPVPVPGPEPEPETVPIAAAAPVVPQMEPEAPAPEPAEPLVPPVPPAAPAFPVGAPTGPPQWPTGPRWPTGIPARQAVPPPLPGPVADPLAAIMARQATEAMWAASSRDVIQPPLVAQVAPIAGVQPCVSCGISLSANARFCRRCGTAQGG